MKKCIYLERNQRIYVDKHIRDEVWFNFSGDYFHVATGLTKQQAEKLIVALQEALEPPDYKIGFFKTNPEDQITFWAVREGHETESDPRGFGATEQEAIDDLEEKIDLS